MTDLDHRALERRPSPEAEWSPTQEGGRRGRRWGGLFWLLLLLALLATLGAGVWRHYQQNRQIVAIAEQQGDFVPNVRVATVQASPPVMAVSLPGTTSPFASANIYAQALTELAARLESAAPAADLLQLQQVSEALRQEFNRTNEFLADSLPGTAAVARLHPPPGRSPPRN